MARIVITTFGSTGDLNPFIALGLALRSNGHDVLFAVEANFQQQVSLIATNDRRTYQTIQQAIKLVAKEKNLSSSWMNDDVTIVIDQIGKPKSPRHWKTFSNLTVYIPELEYILALKLFSGRPQDDRDIQALSQRLHVHTKAQAWSVVNVYIPSTQLGIRGGYTTQAIDRCFTK
jgi:hypothetical protein